MRRRRREGERLLAWLAAEGSDIDDLARFARKPRTDLTAVQAERRIMTEQS